MSDTDDGKEQWQKSGGFASDTEVAQVVCKEDDLEQWDEEAEEQGYGSRSKYLYDLIQEARSYREHGFLGARGDQARIQELEEEVDRLEARLEEKESESSEAVSFDPSTLKHEVLTDQYQSLEEILRSIIESGVLDDALRQPVENQLYFLAARDEVKFRRGFGWKVDDNGGDD
jgi:hypothetical protein